MHRPSSSRRGRAVAACLALGLAACDPPPSSPEAPEPWPRTAACEGLDDWPQAWAELEADALARIDGLRSEGVDCGERGKHGPSAPLQRRAALDCAARRHAMDMATEGYVGRLDPDGLDEHARVEAAEGTFEGLVQHVAAGPPDAQTLVDRTWQPRPVPCATMADGTLTEVGIGHVGEIDDEFGTRWVLLLAREVEDGDAR